MIKEKVESWIQTRQFKAGETIQFDWFIFRIKKQEAPLELETLDFKAMASFTTDFEEVEQIYSEQMSALKTHGVEEEPCVLWHSAVISKSFSPASPGGFMRRFNPLKNNDSGWYIGIESDERDLNDANSFVRKSLYEISLEDKRMLPFWLFPVGTKIHLADSKISINTK